MKKTKFHDMNNNEEMKLFYKLTSAEVHFEGDWTSFLFNLEDLKKMSKLQDNLIMQLLSAGSRFLGSGWSPERAKNRLFELSGCFLEKPQLQTYIEIWLCTIALVTGAPLPPIHLSQDEATAAFELAAACNKAEERSKDQPHVANLTWDVKKIELEKHMQEIWHRAEKGEHPIDIAKLLHKWPKFSQVSSRAPVNNSTGAKGMLDKIFKDFSEKLLNLLQVQARIFENSEREVQF